MYMSVSARAKLSGVALMASAADAAPVMRSRATDAAVRIVFFAVIILNSSHPFDIRQRPGLVEQALRWRIEAEHELELAAGNGRHPVRLHAFGRSRPEIDIH